MTQEWGSPLTGEQMNKLGLPKGQKYQYDGKSWNWTGAPFFGDDSGFRLPADHVAYIAKDEDEYMPEISFNSNEVDVGEIVRNMADTVTIAKMTEAEASARLQKFHPLGQVAAFEALKELGLIKESTREERFWALHKPEGPTIPTHIKKWVKDALEFER